MWVAQGSRAPCADLRLGAVVDHHAEIGVPLEQPAEVRQMRRPYQRVEDEVRRGDRAEARAPARAGASSRRPGCRGASGAGPSGAGPGRASATTSGASGASSGAQPTTPATTGVAAASSRRKRVSATVGAAWTSTVASIPARASSGVEIGRLEVPVDRRLGRGEPAVVGPREAPEVLVGVDAPRSATPSSRRGRVGPDETLRLQIAPERRRDRGSRGDRGSARPRRAPGRRG